MLENFPIHPLLDRVLIQPDQAKQKTEGGLYIPDQAKKEPQYGEIVAVGPGKKDKLLTLKKGDKVVYGEYSGEKISIKGKKYLIMFESDVFATVKA